MLQKYSHDSVTPYNEPLEKKIQVKKMFNTVAPSYDKLNRILSFRIDVLWRKEVVKIIQKKKIQSLLDLATGTGDLAIAIAKKNPEIKIIGADFSEKMLAIGTQKILQHPVPLQIQNQVEDAENMSFQNETFEVVTVAFGVRNFQNLDKGLHEILRVLKPNGVLVVLEFSSPPNPFIRFFYNCYTFLFLRPIGKMLSKDKSAYDYLEKSSKKFASPESFKKILISVGFKNILIKPLSFGICNLYFIEK